MTTWKVKHIINGNTIELENPWIWKDNISGTTSQGMRIEISGYRLSISDKLPDEMANNIAFSRLNSFLLNREITLANPKKVENGVLTCDVFLNEVNIANYFIDFIRN